MQRISVVAMGLLLSSVTLADGKRVGLEEFTESMIAADPEARNILNGLNRSEYLKDLNLPSDHFVLQNKSQFERDTGSSETAHSISTTLVRPFPSLGSKVDLSHTLNNATDSDEFRTR